MAEYCVAKAGVLPHIPLEGSLHLTYRCNFNCRHCWLRIPPSSPEMSKELTAEEIKGIVDEARSLGCRKWLISGGEPMLRGDFIEIFDYITSRSANYSINTNGSLITPEIAELMKRKGSKMVALYGADAEMSDHITRHPGSFRATMSGIENLKEAGASFIVQLIPMKDNLHQLPDMISLAKSLSTHWRIGAPWLYLSARGDSVKNCEIAEQRVEPRMVIELDKPSISDDGGDMGNEPCHQPDDHLFARCIHGRHRFQVDPYGRMTFCSFIVDDADLLYDLRAGSFREGWEEFIPSLAEKVRGGNEYLENCGSCSLRSSCRWCPVHAYQEHRRYSARVEYLCQVAKECASYKEISKKNHCRYYRIAGITLRIISDLPITDTTFDPKFKSFEVEGPGVDNVTIRHHFAIPDLTEESLGEELYHRPPWAIYRRGNSWIYLGIPPKPSSKLHKVAIFNHDFTQASIYSSGDGAYLKGGLIALSTFPTDQILIGRLLADRNSCYMHSSGVVLGGKGLLFVGHSEAGKSTMVKMLKGMAEILCDDRIIVRRHSEGFRIHGTWSHGEVVEVSPASAPLKAVLFLEKGDENQMVPMVERKEAMVRLLSCVVRPFVTGDWWNKTITLLERMASEVPCYSLHFDKSGDVVDLLRSEAWVS